MYITHFYVLLVVCSDYDSILDWFLEASFQSIWNVFVLITLNFRLKILIRVFFYFICVSEFALSIKKGVMQTCVWRKKNQFYIYIRNNQGILRIIWQIICCSETHSKMTNFKDVCCLSLKLKILISSFGSHSCSATRCHNICHLIYNLVLN